MKKFNQRERSLLARNIFRALVFFLFLSCKSFSAFAQCPPNIDFELGDFSGWQLWTGTTVVDNSGPVPVNKINLSLAPGPITGRHTMLSAFPGNGLDFFGQFPQNCPNGSGHSIKLGNTTGGHEAEGASYTFTIPAGQDQYNITYHYAVVFQGPQHATYEQPRLVIEVMNLTDNVKIDCSSFEFFKDINSPLPGFFLSTTNNTGTPVWCKNWSANSIKLDGMAGKTIRVFFKSADCIFTAHFGYAYVDVNTECSSSFVGASYCPDDTLVSVTAPFGYETYTWWNINDPTTILATTQTITIQPPPPAGTILQVGVTPYAGYGCNDILTSVLLDTLSVFANAGPDRLSCEKNPVQLGGNSTPGFVYSWDPVTGLSDPTISNPIATPTVTTTYVLTVRNFGGGCLTTDTVTVKAAVLDTTVTVNGFLTGCITPANPTVLKVGWGAADSIQWYRNNVAIPGATDSFYNVIQTGAYHVTMFSFQGCTLSSTDVDIFVNPTPVVDFTPDALNKCFNGHQFDFTNNSTIAFGSMNYTWDMGDGSAVQTTRDVSYSYADTGTYVVRLIVTSDQGCIDSASYTVTVYESPNAAFSSNTKGVCQKINDFVFTNASTLGVGTMTYLWDYGDGNTDTTRHGRHYYAQPGTYTVTLNATTNHGCPNDTAFNVVVFPEPQVGFSEPNAQQCFGNNQFNFINTSNILTGTMQYLWYLGDGATANTKDVTHSYAMPGDYMVKMVAVSDSGCTDSIAKNVKIFKYAVADFKVEPVCVNQRLVLFNQTINTSPSVLTYLWDFGNGATSTLPNPVYSYPAPGYYPITLTVSNINCPQTLSVKQIGVTIDEPLRGIRYPDVEAVMNFPEQLQARQIANSVLWTPSVNLDFANSYRPSFKGLTSQLYQVQLKTKTGCITVDTQYVKIKKKIEIYVPTTFTPNGDGLNDYLYPVLMGFKQLNYFKIYDRWGQLLFQSGTERPGWNGRTKGNPEAIKTVVWMIEAVDVDGVIHHKQGTTVILR